MLLKYVRPVANRVFDISNSYGRKLLTKFRLGLRHLSYHKLRHDVQGYINPFC